MTAVGPVFGEILCVGPEGSGKTLLLKCLQFANVNKTHEKWSITNIPSHMSTIGTELMELTLSKMDKKPRKKNMDTCKIR